MFGCRSPPAAWASRRNLSISTGAVRRSKNGIFRATSRGRLGFVSNARYTTPIPPCPNSSRISKRPNRSPGLNVRGPVRCGPSASSVAATSSAGGLEGVTWGVRTSPPRSISVGVPLLAASAGGGSMRLSCGNSVITRPFRCRVAARDPRPSAGSLPPDPTSQESHVASENATTAGVS